MEIVLCHYRALPCTHQTHRLCGQTWYRDRLASAPLPEADFCDKLLKILQYH